jgi:transcriptional regulator with XRE-family HTH domain
VEDRRRPPLKPLRSGLSEPVRDFATALREIYGERTALNQRDLAVALHVAKPSLSRYLNGQELMPLPVLDEFGGLAQLTVPERERLRAQWERANSGPVAKSRRTLWLAAAAVVVLVGVALVWKMSGIHDGPPVAASLPSPCAQSHEYRVTANGDVLDIRRNDVGDVHPGDLFIVDKDPTGNPYQARYYGHVVGRNVTGYVERAKLAYAETVCVASE